MKRLLVLALVMAVSLTAFGQSKVTSHYGASQIMTQVMAEDTGVMGLFALSGVLGVATPAVNPCGTTATGTPLLCTTEAVLNQVLWEDGSGNRALAVYLSGAGGALPLGTTDKASLFWNDVGGSWDENPLVLLDDEAIRIGSSNSGGTIDFVSENTALTVEATFLTSGADSCTGDSCTVTTASISPSADKLVLMWIGFERIGAPFPAVELTPTGNGLTWIQVGEHSFEQKRLWVYRSMDAAPSSGVVTFTTSTQTGTKEISWGIVEFGNVVTTGAQGADAIANSTVDNDRFYTPTAGTATAAGVVHINSAAPIAFTAWIPGTMSFLWNDSPGSHTNDLSLAGGFNTGPIDDPEITCGGSCGGGTYYGHVSINPASSGNATATFVNRATADPFTFSQTNDYADDEIVWTLEDAGGTLFSVDGVGDGTVVGDFDIGGKLTVAGLIDPTGLKLTEQAADPGATGVGEGTVWVKNDVPNTLYFTDDDGVDHLLSSVVMPASTIQGSVLRGDGSLGWEEHTNLLLTPANEFHLNDGVYEDIFMNVDTPGALATTDPSIAGLAADSTLDRLWLFGTEVFVKGELIADGWLQINERSGAPVGGAGTGIFWVKDDTITRPYFTASNSFDYPVPLIAFANTGDFATTGFLTTGGGVDIGRLIVDDGTSNTGTIQTLALASDRTYSLPDASGTVLLDGGAGGLPVGLTDYSILYWDGASWVEDPDILAGGSGVFELGNATNPGVLAFGANVATGGFITGGTPAAVGTQTAIKLVALAGYDGIDFPFAVQNSAFADLFTVSGLGAGVFTSELTATQYSATTGSVSLEAAAATVRFNATTTPGKISSAALGASTTGMQFDLDDDYLTSETAFEWRDDISVSADTLMTLSGIGDLQVTGDFGTGAATKTDGYEFLDAGEATTSNASPTSIMNYQLEDDHTYYFRATIIGIDTTLGTERSVTVAEGAFYRENTGSSVALGAMLKPVASASAGAPGTSPTLVIDSADGIDVQVVGHASNTWRWSVTLQAVNLGEL